MVKKYIHENFDVKIHQNLLIEVYMHSVTECIMKDLNIGNISPIADFSINTVNRNIDLDIRNIFQNISNHTVTRISY